MTNAMENPELYFPRVIDIAKKTLGIDLDDPYVQHSVFSTSFDPYVQSFVVTIMANDDSRYPSQRIHTLVMYWDGDGDTMAVDNASNFRYRAAFVEDGESEHITRFPFDGYDLEDES